MTSNHVDKEQWVEIFRAVGMTDEQMGRWHQAFEARNPEGHQEFLEWIKTPTSEISQIRAQ